MRRVLTWLAGLAGIAALARLFSRRSEATPPAVAPASVEIAADPAAELRRRLAESRGDEPPETDQETDQAPPAEPLSLDERRARVHERAKETLDRMHGAGGDTGEDAGPDGAA